MIGGDKDANLDDMYAEFTLMVVKLLCKKEDEYSFKLLDQNKIDPEFISILEVTPLIIH